MTWDYPESGKKADSEADEKTDRKGEGFNVYRWPKGSTIPVVPLNLAPIPEKRFEERTLAYGKKYCFAVTVLRTGPLGQIEGYPSKGICFTPRDTYPPAAPKGLIAMTGRGYIKLLWDLSPDADFGGFNLYRKKETE